MSLKSSKKVQKLRTPTRPGTAAEMRRYEAETGKRATNLFWNGPRPGSENAYEVKAPKIVHKSSRYTPKPGEMNVRQATKKERESWNR